MVLDHLRYLGENERAMCLNKEVLAGLSVGELSDPSFIADPAMDKCIYAHARMTPEL